MGQNGRCANESPANTPPVATATATTTGAVVSAETKVDEDSSYNFNDMDIGMVLTTLARRAGLSLIVGDGVTGKVSLRLENVTPKDAMRLIVESKGLVMQEEKGIVKIRTMDAVENQPLEVRVYTFKYAKAGDLKKVLDEIKGPKGKIQEDTRSNSLVISDTANNLTKITPVLEALDTQTTQVMIEAKFVETTRNPKKELGINWGGTLSQHAITVGGLPKGTSYPTTSVPGGAPGPFQMIHAAGITPWSSPAMLDFGQASAIFSFLNQDSDSELLANPRVVTTDNGKAKITITTQFPIPQFTFSEQTASFQINGFQYKDIGILLNVSPRINKDQMITLEVSPEVSSSSDKVTFSTGSGAAGANFDIPIIDTRQATTTVLIKSGNTLAMGGLLREDVSERYSKVPVMGDVPGLGALFRSKNLERRKRNLLVFLTPIIVNPESQNATGLEKYSNGFPEEEVHVKDKWMPNDNAKPRKFINWPADPPKRTRPATETPATGTEDSSQSSRKAPSQNFGHK
jgi:type IV pilus assembly protein PilQ